MIPDASQRDEAVTTPGHAFVWASAGTGKTHTLTLRALHLLLHAPFDPRARGRPESGLYAKVPRKDRLEAARAVIRRFVLATFTRKAAAEMQSRLYAYLGHLAAAPDREAFAARVAKMNSDRGDAQFLRVVEGALEEVGDFQRLREGAAALAERATEFQVFTLHSYAAAILRRYPIAAGIPPDAEFAEEDEVLPDATERLVERWLEHALADDRLRGQLEKLSPGIPLNDLAEWFAAILKHPWVADRMEFGVPAREEVREFLEAADGLVAGLATARANATQVLAARNDLRDALLLVAKGTTGAWSSLSAVLKRHQRAIFPPKWTQTVARAVAALGKKGRWFGEEGEARPLAMRMCLATDRKAEWGLWREHCRAFRDWSRNAVIRELNLVTFDEMVRRAAELLRENPQVRNDERGRLWALLVDEFQDTDPLQLEILASLLRRVADADHEVMGFFVGDRKQSIYRFRDADLPAIEAFVKNYGRLVRAGPDRVRHFQLTASFRTQPAILGFVNHFFGECVALPGYAGQQLVPVRTDEGPAPEWFRPADEGKGRADARRRAAVGQVVRLVREHVAKAGGSEEALRDVLVLVPTHTEINALLPVFDEAGIPALSSGAKTFYSRAEVLDALNLLVALHNPLDTLAVGALLRSPLFGLSDLEIHRLLATGPAERLFGSGGETPSAFPERCRGRLDAMRGLARDRRRLALGEWLQRVRAFVPAGVYAPRDGEGRAMARVERVIADFRRVVESGGMPPLSWLLEQRSRSAKAGRHDADLGEDVAVTDESASAVRVMTIHKAKGLEGRVVIVYGWLKAIERCEEEDSRKCVLRLTDEDGESIAGFRLPWGKLEIETPGFARVSALDRRDGAAEARRVLYVAATRARDRLVLVAEGHPEKGVLAGDGDLGEALGGRAVLGSYGEEERRPSPTVRPRVRVAPEAYAKLWMARAEAVVGEAAPLVRRPSGPEHPEEEETRDAEDFTARRREGAREAARIAGILVHAYLERHLRDAGFDPKKLEIVIANCAGEGEVALGRERTAKILEEFFGSPNHERARAARVLGREMPVFLRQGDEAWNGVMDLVFEEKGRVVGVDFKTRKEPSPLPEEYQGQQRIYTEALRRVSGGKAVAFEFWWLAVPG